MTSEFLRSPRFEPAVATLLLTLCWVVCFANAMTEPINRDEHMYLAAASLAAEHRPYEDFAFLQTPYSVWVYRGVDVIAPSDWVLLPARLFKTVVNAAMIVALFVLLRKLGARPILGALLTLLLFQDGLIRDMVGLARNYDFAQFCVLGGAILLPLRRGETATRGRVIAAAALGTAAVGFKLTYAPFGLALVGWPLLRGGPERWSQLGWSGAGAAVGLLPFVIGSWGIALDALRFNLLDYHFLNAEFHAHQGYLPYASIAERARIALALLLGPEHWPLAAVGLLGFLLAWVPSFRSPDPDAPGPGRGPALAWIGLFLAAITAVVPRPLQVSYLSPMLVGCTVLAAAYAGRSSKIGRVVLTIVTAVMCTTGVLTHLDDAHELVDMVSRPTEWTGVASHRTGEEIRRQLGPAEGRRIATVHPIYALEAGFHLYPELGAAEFAWRSAPLLDAGQRERYHVASGSDIADIFARRQPAAILIEDLAPWDGPLVIWAADHLFQPVGLADETLSLWKPGPG
jgi:hypothetical protein